MASTAVLGIRYETGVVVAADTLLTYGTMARFQSADRVFKINDRVLFGGGGSYADIMHSVNRLREDAAADSLDNYITEPKQISMQMTHYLAIPREERKKKRMNIIIAGMNKDDKPYLANVDSCGFSFEDYVLGTGFANDYCVPFVCQSKPSDREFTAKEAITLIRDSMKLLFYRHTHSIPMYTIGVCNKFGCSVKGPFKVEENWDLQEGALGF